MFLGHLALIFIDVTLLFGVLASILFPLPSVLGLLLVPFGMQRVYLRLPYTTQEVTIAKQGSLRESKRLNAESGRVAFAKRLYRDRTIAMSAILKTLNISKVTLYRWMDIGGGNRTKS